MKIGYFAPRSEFPDAIRDELKARLPDDELVQWEPGQAVPDAEIRVLLSLGPVTRELLGTLSRLLLVQTLSDGYEAVDIDAATELGIRVSFSPADVTGNADSVAEYAILLLLATARRLPVALASIRDPSIVKPGRGRTLLGARVCIIGMGAIGTRIAHRLLTFGVHLTGVDKFPSHAPKHIPTYTPDRLKEAVVDADFVVLSLRASTENTHMIDASVLAAMKKGAILINVARGLLVNEGALCEAIMSGHLGGAGLDVEEHEPISLDDPLLGLPEVFLTPHEAGLTQLTIQGTVDHIVDALAKLATDEEIPSQLNQPLSPRMFARGEA